MNAPQAKSSRLQVIYAHQIEKQSRKFIFGSINFCNRTVIYLTEENYLL